MLAKVKEAPGNVSLETMLTEIDKLLAVRAGGRGPRWSRLPICGRIRWRCG